MAAEQPLQALGPEQVPEQRQVPKSLARVPGLPQERRLGLKQEPEQTGQPEQPVPPAMLSNC